MKFASVSMIVAAALAVIPSASAEANEMRLLDEHSYELMGHVRSLDWDIRDGFVTARDYRTLCRMSDNLRRSVRDIDDSIYRGRNLAVIERDLCRAKDDVVDLRKSITGCQLGRVRQHGLHSGLRHGQIDYGRTMRGTLARVVQIERTIDCMIDDVERLQSPHRRHSSRVVPPVNSVPYEVRPFPGVSPNSNRGPNLTPRLPEPFRPSANRPLLQQNNRTRTVQWKGLRFTVNVP